MKRFIIVLLVIFFLLSFSFAHAMVNSYSLVGKTIYLDAGHGGKDSGAIYRSILEKDINLIIVKKIEKELISRGAKVYLTRENDYDLSTTNNGRKRSDLKNRASLINESDCDMYVSIHLNYINDSRWKGLQIFYNDKNKSNSLIAKNMTNYLKEHIKNVRDSKKSSDYYMYNLIYRPGILIELGFLSNPDDRYVLTKEKYQDELVNNLVNAIDNYFNKMRI